MKIVLLCVGKLRAPPLRELCAEYAARLARYGPFETREVQPARAGGAAAAVREECARLGAAFQPGDVVWILDERGKSFASADWAKRLSTLENRSVRRLVVVLGGAYGLDDALRARGECLALSPLTFPHDLCRAIVLEQLYRARTIQRGEPYHHGSAGR